MCGKSLADAVEKFESIIDELGADGLLVRTGGNLRLTNRGRLLSNEVFGRFIEEEKLST